MDFRAIILVIAIWEEAPTPRRIPCPPRSYSPWEKTRNEAKLNEYRQLVPASSQKHPGKFRAIYGREAPDGSAIEEIVLLEFPTFEDATPWYHGPEYQAARERSIITEGLPA
jgi:uncharacterized protein (DUF1330 family)